MSVTRRRRLVPAAVVLAAVAVAATGVAPPTAPDRASAAAASTSTAGGTSTVVSTSAVAATGSTAKKLPRTRCRVFPRDSIFHADVSRLPVHPRSATWLANMGDPGQELHPDLGPSYGEQPVPYGIPATVVGKKHKKHQVRFGYASESDRVRYPLGKDTRIEGGRGTDGDRHAIVVNRKTCKLYETFDTRRTARGWTAGSGAVWDLDKNTLRPKGWTSADAAGLPILAGLLRYDEVRKGRVDHPIRFTTDVTSRAFLWPARHHAGSTDDPAYPPMGAWFRMKDSFSTKRWSRDAKVVLRGMKKHGMVLADNGSPWYFQGTADKRWPPRLVEELKRIPASAFEAVDVSGLKVKDGSGRTR
jgi:hypothetical protein